jgi:hypothetical protein
MAPRRELQREIVGKLHPLGAAAIMMRWKSSS